MLTPDVLRHVIETATLAPSVHNTQPWRFSLLADGFELHADPQRALEVLDPTLRQLHVSCGAALLTARVAARALGLDSHVTLLPEPASPGRLARLTLSQGAPPGDAEIALALAILKRHTVRDVYDPRPVPLVLLHELGRLAEREGAALRLLHGQDETIELAVLLSQADRLEEQDPAYGRELRAWFRGGTDDGPADGIPASALPAGGARGALLRGRDFTLTVPERGSSEAPDAEDPAVVVLTTGADDPEAWLRAGQALGLILLHAAAQGVQAQPLGQVVDLPGPRWALARALGLVGVPQMVLRLGYARGQAATPRLGLEDVLV
jgi:nitroreductase